jgi:type II pantothenate kinase
LLHLLIPGTSLGGGTLWGLLSLLTDANSYDDMLELSQQGDNKNVDMLVGDIYGGAYNKIGLKSSTIASSFGKVFKMPKEERHNIKQEDISRSLLYLLSNNIGQIAYLNALSHGIKRIYFSGFFIRGHPITMNTLSFAVNFWSQGQIKALFLRHEGYLGAIGAFLSNIPNESPVATSFTENFSHVSKIASMSCNKSYFSSWCHFSSWNFGIWYTINCIPVPSTKLQMRHLDAFKYGNTKVLA